MDEVHIRAKSTRRSNLQNSQENQKFDHPFDALIQTNDAQVIDQIPKRGKGIRTTYQRERESVYQQMSKVSEIYLRGGEPTQEWHEKVGDLLARRYELAGWSRSIFMTDWAMLKDICGDRHPSQVFLQDLEDKVLRGQTAGTRENYVGRLKSVFNSLRMLGVIDLTHRPDDGLPKIRVTRATPRPLSREQVLHLISNAVEPINEWFLLAALTGMRAIEISRIEGSWLENHGGRYLLRIYGKGNTDLLIPAHPKVVELIESKKTLGKLYHIQPNYLSRKACEEMRRLGIMTKHNKDKKGSRLSFHSFRHFFATEMLQNSGGNLVVTARLMRHASPIVTMRYADLVNDEERKVVDSLFADLDWNELHHQDKEAS